ncbi:MAG TPA: HlyD family efflux transporter periplasmic adaptor subunit [Gemmatimonadales bacterium]|jgi:HlyD family secretion protein|nr:HlyD family efflux transporter periplasmic adaptor subunit [Gemmatimonadales bacterium]
MTLRRKHLWYAVGVAAAAWLAIRLLRPEAIAVEVASVTVGRLEETVGDEGQTRARHRHIVTAPVPGRLERIALEVGDTVAVGAVVARLAPLPLDTRSRLQAEAALEASRDLERRSVAAVAQARAALNQAQQDRRRADQLVEAGGIARAEAERLRLAEEVRQREVEGAEAAARAAAHDLESARSALMASGTAAGARTLRLTCPIGGRVLAIPERSARTVQAGESLLEVGDPTDLEIVVDLLSTDAVKASPGQRMLVTGWGGDSVLEGRVRRVDPAGFTKISALGVEEQRVNVVGDLLAVPGRLGDRFRLEARLVLWEGDSVVKVPASALFRRGDRWALFVVEDGKAREREVKVGHESATEAEITAGVVRGDVVIRHPTDRVRDGARVTYLP